jgi:hypothetical protein
MTDVFVASLTMTFLDGFVMPGLVPGIHVLNVSTKDVDGRDNARP